MRRYVSIKGPLKCYHVDDSGGKPLSSVVIVDHNVEAEAFAFYLRQAAAWFDAVGKGEIAPESRAPRSPKLREQPHASA